MLSCPFCERIHNGDVIAGTERAVAFRDAHPVSRGHTLIVPTAHESDFFALPVDDQAAVWALVTEIYDELTRELATDGCNVGLNNGKAAGQTVDHAHVRVIPRYAGDVADPRGGVRWVIP